MGNNNDKMIVRRDGYRVDGKLIEDIIQMHYAVEDCSVIGIPTYDNKAFIPTAIIVLKEEYRPSEMHILIEINNLCDSFLEPKDMPKNYLIRNEIPRDELGNIDINKVLGLDDPYVKKLTM